MLGGAGRGPAPGGEETVPGPISEKGLVGDYAAMGSAGGSERPAEGCSGAGR